MIGCFKDFGMVFCGYMYIMCLFISSVCGFKVVQSPVTWKTPKIPANILCIHEYYCNGSNPIISRIISDMYLTPTPPINNVSDVNHVGSQHMGG